MKKNRRQELQTNILADRLGGVINRWRPYFKAIGVVAGILVVALAVFSWQRASAKKKTTAFWQKFMDISVQAELAKSSGADGLGATTNLQRQISAFSSVASELEFLADKNKEAAAVGWVRAAAGDAYLSVAMRQLYTDQGEARQSFRRALGIYEDLIADGPQEDKDLQDRIRYGYAQACEGLSFVPADQSSHDKYLKDAQEVYRELAENGVASGIKLAAERRLQILSPIAGKTWEEGKLLPERADWASWLAQQDLPEPPPPLQNGGLNPPGGAALDPSAVPPLLKPSPEPPAGGTGSDAGSTDKSTPESEDESSKEEGPPSSGDKSEQKEGSEPGAKKGDAESPTPDQKK